MKIKIFLLVVLTLSFFNLNAEEKMKITNESTLTSTPGAEKFFTGNVDVVLLFSPVDASTTLSAGKVTFSPGSRSAWHTHPMGQLLIVTDGEGYIQEWKGAAKKIQKGDVIWTPPNVKHWHGATPKTSLTHTAIQEAKNGKNVEWLEKVTDDQYLLIK